MVYAQYELIKQQKAHKCHVEVKLQGNVQGVGCRPFVYNLATSLGLTGWVCNSASGCDLAIEGSKGKLLDFFHRLEKLAPSSLVIHDLQLVIKPLAKYHDFKILPSKGRLNNNAVMLPDLATCKLCLQDILDPANRRYNYPFTNCTQCGPRYSIITKFPYDRKNTTMKIFTMCAACEGEYNNPQDRRFHAEPIACPDCGPELWFTDNAGKTLSRKYSALQAAAQALKDGKIVAIKGLAGFHFYIDAQNKQAIAKLRQRKNRPAKPLALMVTDVLAAREICEVDALAEQWLTSVCAPIILLPKSKNDLPANIAFASPYLGIMLPYTPMQHLLVQMFAGPLVVTSANVSGEPICIDNTVALASLSNIADHFLCHDREIKRRAEDSVMQFVAGRPQVLRRGRGFATGLYHNFSIKLSHNILAVGGHLKNTFLFGDKDKLIMSPHIGDLDTYSNYELFVQTQTELSKLYGFTPEIIACDKHRDYLSSQYAHKAGNKVIATQHHHAHIVACMLEHNLTGPVLGLVWDGAGLGTDNTIWGSEFLLADRQKFKQIGQLLPFNMPNNDLMAQKPNLSAFSILHVVAKLQNKNLADLLAKLPHLTYSAVELQFFTKCLTSETLALKTTSMGRLFDAVASILGLVEDKLSFEGQAAMELQHLAEQIDCEQSYIVKSIVKSNLTSLDWRYMLVEILTDLEQGITKATIAAKFHNTLVQMIKVIAKNFKKVPIVLTGGCMQNRLLLTKVVQALFYAGFKVYWPEQFPANDGGLAVGQLGIAAAQMERENVLSTTW